MHIIDIERPKGSTNHPLIPLSDENVAFAESMGVNPAATPCQEHLKECRA